MGIGSTPLDLAWSSISKFSSVDRYTDFREALKIFGYVVSLLAPLLLMVSTAVGLLTRMVSYRIAMWDCTLREMVSYN